MYIWRQAGEMRRFLVITVNGDFLKLDDFHKEFMKKAKELGLKGPFDCETTKAERDKYYDVRDKYLAKRCFEELGYENFLQYATKDMIAAKGYEPCRAAGGQCRFDCVRFAECALQAAEGLD